MKTSVAPAHPDLFSDAKAHGLPLGRFPTTRYQGSKRRLLDPLSHAFQSLKVGSAIDLYAGTATVSLLLRLLGWRVTANDFLRYNNVTAALLLKDFPTKITPEDIKRDLTHLLEDAVLQRPPLVRNNFSGIYFHDDENLQIDRFCQNIDSFSTPTANLYRYAVGQALLMKRPYNLFHRANLNMRTRSVKRSFGNITTWNKPIAEHAVKIAIKLSEFPFPENSHAQNVTSHNTLDISALPDLVDMVYLDPPYLNSSGLGVDYCSFYHFLDGLSDYQLYAKYDDRYPHRPIIANPSAWMTNSGALEELDRVLGKWRRATIVLSYRNDGRPTFEEISQVFRSAGRYFTAIDERAFKYALSHKSDTKELVLISPPA